MQGREQPERRIARIKQEQAARLKGGEMLDQKVAFVAMIGSDQGVKNEAVEWIVDLGDPRQGRRSAVGGDHLTERGDGVRRVGQAQGRAVDGAQVKTVPAPDKMSVQVDERARFELLTGCAQRAFGDSALGHVGAVQDLKEVIQFPLERAFDQVQQEQEHDRKGQGPVTGEICFRASMPGKKGRIVDQITK